jgi:hypothetical protein
MHVPVVETVFVYVVSTWIQVLFSVRPNKPALLNPDCKGGSLYCVCRARATARAEEHKKTFCEIPRDDLFSDDFGFKINKLVCNLAHIFILRRPLIKLLKNRHRILVRQFSNAFAVVKDTAAYTPTPTPTQP